MTQSAFDLLILGLTEPTKLAELSTRQWQDLIRIARHAGLLSRIALSLEKLGILNELDEYPKRHLQSAIHLANKQSNQVLFELSQLVASLQLNCQYHFILKGAAYTLLNNQASQGRLYSDIDILVDQSSLSNIESSLGIVGWLGKTLDDYDEHYYRQWAHEIPPLKHAGRGTVLDIHHNIVPPVSGQSPDINLYIDNPVQLKSGLYTLRPAAMTLHSAIHLFFNEEFDNGLRDLHDLHLLISEYGSDDEYWRDLVSLAMRSGFSRELFLAARYCQLWFKTQIPTAIVDELEQALTNKSLRVWDFMFVRVLRPDHPLTKVRFRSLASLMALIRGHKLKMPWVILIRHLGHKAYKAAMTALLGKAYFDKQELP